MDNLLKHKIAVDYWLQKTQAYEAVDISGTTTTSLPLCSPSFILPQPTAATLKKVCNDKDAGIYLFFQTALFILLHKYSSAGKLMIASSPVLSLKTGTGGPLFLEAAMDPGSDSRQLILALQDELKMACQHQEYPFEKFKEQFGGLYGPVTPLSNYSLSYYPFTEKGKCTTDLKFIPGEECTTDFKLFFAIERTEESFSISISNGGHFADWFITRMGEHYSHILHFIVHDPAAKIRDIPLLSDHEKHVLLETFNDTWKEFPEGDLTIIEMIERQANYTPLQTAVQAGDKEWSYQMLMDHALQLATVLRNKGLGRNDRVALICDRSAFMIIGMLGSLKAGVAYVPIDPDIPEHRADYIIRNSGAQLVLTTRAVCHAGPGLFNKYPGMVVMMDEVSADLEQTAIVEWEKNLPEDPAYIIYTSGSTGNPKGIIILHQGFTNLVLAFKEKYASGFNQDDRCLALANIAFDASVGEIYMCLTSGSTLVILDKERLFDPQRLAAFLAEEAITFAYIPPVLLKDVLAGLQPYRSSIKLNKLFVGVEAIKDTLMYEYCALIPGLDILNAYGPTETTVICSGFNYIPETPKGENVCIGKPIANYKIYILNNFLELLPVGATGEVCISGPGVAQCYLNNEELTEAKFVDDPFVKGKKMFRSGDLARWTPEGNIVFVGRRDNQVKIRGYRVEIGEIESVLLKHPFIKEAVVSALEEDAGNKFLHAWLVLNKGVDPSIVLSEISAFLLQQLPQYMVPAGFLFIESIPITSNGKTDRRKLPSPGIVERVLEEKDMPSGVLEIQLAAIWKEILNIKQAGVNDNFFEMGGHSLKAAKLITLILRELHTEVPLRQVFASGTIRQLAKYIEDSGQTSQWGIPIAPDSDHYPASFAQRRIYLSCQLNKEVTNYNMPVGFLLKGVIDPDRFQQAITAVIERQASLRTGFSVIDGVLVQRVFEKVSFEIGMIREEGQEKPGSAQQLHETIATLIRPFDLARPPLLRVFLIERSKDESILLLDMHHIISDGISLDLLIKEFTLAYYGEYLPPLSKQYTDYACWQDEFKRSPAFERQRAWLLNNFRDKQESVSLPLDHPRPNVNTYEGDCITVRVDQDTVTALRNLSGKETSTMFLTCFAAYNVLLYKYSGQHDIIIGTPVAGRIHPDLHGIIGMFVNTLPLRTILEPEQPFKVLMQQCKEGFFKALDNQLYPFEELFDALDLPRSGSRNPLFDTLFAYQNLEIADLQIRDLSITPIRIDETATKFDLSLEIFENGKELSIDFIYSKDLFKRSTIKKLAEHYLAILKIIARDAATPIRHISLMEQQEWGLPALQGISGSRALQESSDFPNNAGTILQLFERQAAISPAKTAVSFQEIEYSYALLNQKADNLAAYWISTGLKKGEIVAVLAQRNEQLILGLLAIWKAGGVYLPIDPNYPAQRIGFILEDAGCSYLLLTGEMPGPVSALLDGKSIPQLGFETEDPIADGRSIPDRRSITSGGSGETGGFIPGSLPLITNSDRAYIIYTSGSTGKPKGVIIEHGSIANYISWAADYYVQGMKGDMPLFTSLAFDLTLTALFTPLVTGNAIVIYDSREEGLLIEKILSEDLVDIVKLTPAHLKLLNNMDPLLFAGNRRIRALVVGGEALDTRLAAEISYKFGRPVLIFNEYGPTEATVGCMIYTFNPLDDLATVPIGLPIRHTHVFLTDADGQVCPEGITGEICIAGAGVASGYLNREALTKERFGNRATLFGNSTEHLFSSERIYRTGDLGRWLPDGNMIFAGRKDEQVKINGYRIEPAEIETALLSHPAIREAVVVPYAGKGAVKTLVAYYTGKDIADLKTFVSGQLPSYMVPAHFIRLEAFPLTSNGKIDRKALPKPTTEDRITAMVAPSNPMESRLLELWQEALENPEIGVTHHFFESGGHSLKALILVSRIQKAFHIEVTLKDIFNHPTVVSLAHYLGNASDLPFVPISRGVRRSHYPLSSAQKRIFVMSHFKGAETSYNMYAAFRVDGPLVVHKLESAFRRLADRHESLRTSFAIIDDEPVQVVHDHIEFHLESISVLDSVNAALDAFVRKFDLSQAPLFRAGVMVVSANCHLIFFDMHHIIADGVSLDIFFRELWEIYDGHQLPDLAIQYTDYAAWQDSFFKSGAIGPQRIFWQKQFEGELPVLELPLDLPRPLNQTFEGRNEQFELDDQLTEKVFEFINAREVTLNMFMLAVYNILLAKYSSTEDIIIGTPVAGRTHADLEPVIGMFVNTLALRNYPVADKSFEQFLQEVKKNALSAYENQDYPFEELIEMLDLQRDTSRNPLFDTMFLIMNRRPAPVEQTLTFTACPVNARVAKFDLTFETVHSPGKIDFLVNYNTALFKPESIRRLTQHFTHIIAQVLDTPSMQLKQIALADQKEMEAISALSAGVRNKTCVNTILQVTNVPRTIPDQWKTQVIQHSGEIALVAGTEQLSFAALDHRSSALVTTLTNTFGIRPGDRIALVLHRTVDLPVVMLAVLKAGAAYVPVDPHFPQTRISFMMEHSDCSLIISDTETQEYSRKVPVYDIRQMSLQTDASNTGWSEDMAPVINPSDLAYIIYTSGSTGQPKGVMISHSNVTAFTVNLASIFNIVRGDTILALTNITFDISVLEILCSLMAGIRVVLADDLSVNDFDKIGALITKQQINVLQLTPSRLSMLLNGIGNGFMRGIKTLLVGGEAMPEELFNTLRGFRHTRVFNVYGPTETCIWSSTDEIKDDKITIGRSLLGEQLFILDTQDHLQPINIPGEICIAGSGVGNGYYKMDDLTAKNFFRDQQLGEGTIYRTGDRARLLSDGRIEYIGRIDTQVKIGGYRIELAEIENVLLKLDGIRLAAVIVREFGREKQLIGFYESDRYLTDEEIRQFLEDRLPHYMIPAYSIHLPAIPLNSSGKIDRRALSNHIAVASPLPGDRAIRAERSGYEEPVGDIQKSLAIIWRDILKIEPIGIADNFFKIGGTSIKLIQILNRMKKEMGIDLPLTTAFKYTTIKELAGHIRTMGELGRIQEELPYALVNPGKPQTIFCFPPFIGYSFLYTAFAEYLPEYTLCCFHFLEAADRMEQYGAMIREMQQDGPLILMGYSVGGNFAFELTQWLENQGQEVGDLILIDSYKQWKPESKTAGELENDVITHLQNIDFSIFGVEVDFFETIKEKAYQKMIGYARLLNDRADSGRIQANIHLITCEEKMDSPVRNRDWRESTESDFLVYEGKGMHPQMLLPEYLPENAIHLRSIMKITQDSGRVMANGL